MPTIKDTQKTIRTRLASGARGTECKTLLQLNSILKQLTSANISTLTQSQLEAFSASLATPLSSLTLPPSPSPSPTPYNLIKDMMIEMQDTIQNMINSVVDTLSVLQDRHAAITAAIASLEEPAVIPHTDAYSSLVETINAIISSQTLLSQILTDIKNAPDPMIPGPDDPTPAQLELYKNANRANRQMARTMFANQNKSLRIPDLIDTKFPARK